MDRDILKVYRDKSELCVWKAMELNPNSTTFYDVKNGNSGYKHPLYKCISCDGYDKNCKGYRPLKYIEKNKKKEEDIIKHYISEYL